MTETSFLLAHLTQACTHTHVYINHIPVPPRSLACATISSSALGTCRHCPLAQLFHLLQALPHFLPICQVLFPTLPLLVVYLQCLSGLAGPHFCYIEVPPVIVSTGYFHTFVWRCHFCSMAAPCQCPALAQLLCFCCFP